ADIGPAWSHGVSFNAGVALRPTKKLDLALVYQHGSRMRLNGDFVLNMDDDFFTQDLAAQGLQFPPEVRGRAHIELSLPKRLTVGAGYQFHPKVSVDGAFSYVFYSDFDVIDIALTSPDLPSPRWGSARRCRSSSCATGRTRCTPSSTCAARPPRSCACRACWA